MQRKNNTSNTIILYVVGLIVVIMILILGNHYRTDQTPDPTAFTLPVLNLPVYWYGIVVMSSIALATWVVSRLLHTQAIIEFERAISAEIRNRSLTTLNLSPTLIDKLKTKKISTIGEWLWQSSFAAATLKLSDDETTAVNQPLDRIVDSHTLQQFRLWNPEHAWGVVVWMLLLGVVGARLYHVLTPQPSMGITPNFYFQNPLAILNLRNGGLGIFGAIIGAIMGLVGYVRRYKLPLGYWLDLGTLAGVFTQFMGRWANYFNQELYGNSSNLPWAIRIDSPPSALAQFSHFHPTFLYESIWSLLTFLLLYRLWPHKRPSTLLGYYLILYGFGRILLEMIRLDSNTTGGISTAALMSVGMIISGGMWLLIGRQRIVLRT